MGQLYDPKDKEAEKAFGLLGLLFFLPLLFTWIFSLMRNCLVPIFLMGTLVVIFTYFCYYISR